MQTNKKLIKKFYFELMNNKNLNDNDESKIIYEINQLSPDPEISNYIFGKEYEHLTIDEIIEKAFSYQPIILGDQSQKTD